MRILLIEDEVKLASAFKTGLTQKGYAVDIIHDGQEGLEQLEISHDEYDLAVIDVMLPHVNGFDICVAIRKQDIPIPVILMTAKDSVNDKVTGLDSGADDYVVKPVAFAELLARIRSLLRRPKGSCMTTLRIRNLTLDPSDHRVYMNGTEIMLTSKEFGILEYLMRNSGKTISRETLISHIWDRSFDTFSNVVDVHIANLKRKLDNAGHDTFIESVRGTGYRIRT